MYSTAVGVVPTVAHKNNGTRLASTSWQIWARSESGNSAYDVDLEVLMALKFVGWIPAICAAFWIAPCVWSEA